MCDEKFDEKRHAIFAEIHWWGHRVPNIIMGVPKPEFPPQTRVEGEIQQLDKDHPITELWCVIAGQAQGRRSQSQITLFDSVGFATEDFSALRYIYDQLETTGHYVELDLLADPDDPRDLFGMVRRADTAHFSLTAS